MRVVEPETGTVVSFEEAPERWMRALPSAYRGDDVRVDVDEDDDPEDDEDEDDDDEDNDDEVARAPHARSLYRGDPVGLASCAGTVDRLAQRLTSKETGDRRPRLDPPARAPWRSGRQARPGSWARRRPPRPCRRARQSRPKALGILVAPDLDRSRRRREVRTLT